MIVSDCTLLTHLHVETVDTEAARAVWRRDSAWLAPPLWRSEFRNVLIKYVGAGHLGLVDATAAMSSAEQLIGSNERPVLSADVLSLASSTGCSACDAEYVSLAQTHGVALVTSDGRLLRLFPGIAVPPRSFADG